MSSRYVEPGVNYPYIILGGATMPDNVISGRFTYGYQDDKSGWEFMVGTTGLHYSASTLIAVWSGDAWANKTLCAWQWSSADHHVIKCYLKTTATEHELKFQLRDETEGTNLIESTADFYSVLQACFSAAKTGVNIGLARARRFYYATDAEWKGTIRPFIWGDIVDGDTDKVSNAYMGMWTGAIADAEGTTEQVLLYEALTGQSVENDYLGNGVPRKKDHGVYEGRDDEIGFPDLPTDSALVTKFLRLYHMDQTAIDDLATELWNNNFTSNILKNYDSPFENIISLNILPFAITGTSTIIMIGNYQTAISGEMITSQYVDLDGGSVTLPMEFGNQFDYQPATSCQIYIPFIGYRDIDMDDLAGGMITLKYRVDLLTGNLLAMLQVWQETRYNHKAVEYFYSGNCATSIPINGANYNNIYASMMQGITAGATSLMAGNVGGVVGSASSIQSMKPSYQRSGSLSGNIGFMGQTRAFLLISQPEEGFDPKELNSRGIRCNEEYSFSALSGYTEVKSWRPNSTLSAACTKEELDEIDRLLKEGVIF